MMPFSLQGEELVRCLKAALGMDEEEMAGLLAQLDVLGVRIPEVSGYWTSLPVPASPLV